MKTKKRLAEMTQKEMVLYHIDKYGNITDLDAAYRYGIMRLGSVIHLLRKDGYKIKTTLTSGRNRFKKNTNFAVYTMED